MRPILTTEEAATVLNLSPRTLESLRVRGGGPPFVRFGRSIRYRAEDLDAWIADRCRYSSTSQYEKAS